MATVPRFAGERLAAATQIPLTATEPLPLARIKQLFAAADSIRLGKGRQGSVVQSEDGRLAIKRQPLIPSPEEARHGVDAASAAYMSAMVGREGLGPKVYQYEVDEPGGSAYLVMENLTPMGYKPLSALDQSDYKTAYARQQLLEARAADAGIGLRDTHSENVMVNPETNELMFIDQGYSKPLRAGQPRAVAQVLSAANGLRNLGEDQMAEGFVEALKESMVRKDPDAIAALSSSAVQALEGLVSAQGR